MNFKEEGEDLGFFVCMFGWLVVGFFNFHERELFEQ